jgi:hypothetical protein
MMTAIGNFAINMFFSWLRRIAQRLGRNIGRRISRRISLQASVLHPGGGATITASGPALTLCIILLEGLIYRQQAAKQHFPGLPGLPGTAARIRELAASVSRKPLIYSSRGA